MYLKKSFLCVIPARANSRRLKNKNMHPMCGKPLIHWAIKAAKDSGIFNDIILLSDSSSAQEYAKQQGIMVAEEPIGLAEDNSYIGDALIWLLEHYYLNSLYDYIQLIEPTSPLIRPSMIQNAVEYLIDKDADFVISMCEAEAPNGVAKPISNSLCVTDWWPEELFAKRSQDCESAYRVDGLIYVGKPNVWLQRNYWKSKIYAFITEKRDSIDINDAQDFEVAEAILAKRLRHK